MVCSTIETLIEIVITHYVLLSTNRLQLLSNMQHVLDRFLVNVVIATPRLELFFGFALYHLGINVSLTLGNSASIHHHPRRPRGLLLVSDLQRNTGTIVSKDLEHAGDEGQHGRK